MWELGGQQRVQSSREQRDEDIEGDWKHKHGLSEVQKEPRSRARKGYERNEVVRIFVFRKSVKTRRKKVCAAAGKGGGETTEGR